MDGTTLQIKPVILDSATLQSNNPGENRATTSTAGRDAGSLKETDKQGADSQRDRESRLTAEKAKELVKNVQSYLDDLDISIDFEFQEKTGDLVTKVINRNTKEVIRQIPPEALLKLREQLAEQRGVLFNGKA